jgi:hypothetical protein
MVYNLLRPLKVYELDLLRPHFLGPTQSKKTVLITYACIEINEPSKRKCRGKKQRFRIQYQKAPVFVGRRRSGFTRTRYYFRMIDIFAVI